MRCATRRIRAISRVEQALAWIARVKPKRAVLTHMHVDLDYETLDAGAAGGVEPAYDGMVLTTESAVGTLTFETLQVPVSWLHGADALRPTP